MSNDLDERRLAAVLAADVAGFSRLTDRDEVGTMRQLSAQRVILDGAIVRHRGRIANTAGDSVLAEFPSVVNAVQCAVEAQHALHYAAETEAEDRRVLFRIGIHVGDVMVRGGDLFGGGVNVAARLEGLAQAGGIVISAAAHEQVRKILPLAYTDLGAQRLRNIEEPVHAFAIGATQGANAPIAADSPRLFIDKPSIAVLPFQNMSGDPEQEYFADGMVEDIITALARFKSLFVIARNSSFTYKGSGVDIRQVGRELGVRYVLEGSVRKSGKQLRITGQLIEAATGIHLWADRFDGALEDIFELQDRVTSSVVGVIAPRIEKAELDRSLLKSTSSLDAYDLYLRGLTTFNEWTAESSLRALQLFLKAVELDPQFATAMAQICNCYNQRQLQGWVSDPVKEAMEALRWAKLARETAPDDAFVMVTAGWTLAYFGADGSIMALFDHALQLNPNLALGWTSSGWLRLSLGDYPVARDHLTRALQLNPTVRYSLNALVSRSGMAAVHFLEGDYEQAIDWAQKPVDNNPVFLGSLRIMAAAQFAAGHHDAALRFGNRIREINPAEALSKIAIVRILRNSEDRARLAAALRGAGIPD